MLQWARRRPAYRRRPHAAPACSGARTASAYRPTCCATCKETATGERTSSRVAVSAGQPLSLLPFERRSLTRRFASRPITTLPIHVCRRVLLLLKMIDAVFLPLFCLYFHRHNRAYTDVCDPLAPGVGKITTTLKGQNTASDQRNRRFTTNAFPSVPGPERSYLHGCGFFLRVMIRLADRDTTNSFRDPAS